MDDQRIEGFEVAIFEGRIITEAVAPATEEAIAAIEEHLAGPVPDGLRELWAITFGGRLDYDLRFVLDEAEVSLSFRELFYPESDGYRDLMGWIENELEVAEEAAMEEGRDFDGKLDYLPFGGFEYLERMYVRVAGDDVGGVYVWSRGLPPAWRLRHHGDAVGRIADDVRDLFGQLNIERDPRTLPEGEWATGDEMWRRIEEIAQSDSVLGEQLEALLDAAIVDWRALLDDGSIAASKLCSQLALNEALSAADTALIDRLGESNVELGMRLQGMGSVVDLAMYRGQWPMVRHLLTHGLMPLEGLGNCNGTVPLDLAETLLERGAQPFPHAAVECAIQGNVEVAHLFANAAVAADETANAAMIDAAKRRADNEVDCIRGKMAGNVFTDFTQEEHRQRALWLRDFGQWVAGERAESAE